jgi:hypothetical protein
MDLVGRLYDTQKSKSYGLGWLDLEGMFLGDFYFFVFFDCRTCLVVVNTESFLGCQAMRQHQKN